VQLRKRKQVFIKKEITVNIDTTFRNIEAFEPLVHVTIAQEHTTFRSILELVSIIGPKMGPTSTPKDSHGGIVGLFGKKFVHGCIKVYDFTRRAIDKINGSKKGLIPIF
jgi:hypothetical protein